MEKTAFVFPGQGSQYIGMGKAFLETLSRAREIFEIGEAVTGIPLKTLCLEGPMDELTKTANLQPALTAIDTVCAAAAMDSGLMPGAVAGHSLGEYPALWAAGVIGLEDLFRLVQARGRLMEEAGARRPGAMAAIIGLKKAELDGLIQPLALQGVIAAANHNSPEQIVVTGEKALVDALAGLVKERGARAVPLKVGGAYHSQLMKNAADKFARLLEEVRFSPPKTPFYSNVTAGPENDPEVIKGLMARQMCEPVRWYEIVTNMVRDGVKEFIEPGPKNVLSNLVKKCLPQGEVRVFQIDDPEGLKACLSQR
ncbi:MAG: ACP S-malonyltransferase [Dissulfurimicrobium sp.]|uniref:ACP S-malonyltransferase n=1 Tax=Dissulfurimicrobium sp. TaxID=2022436 RepID=UPI003D0FA048